MTLTYGVDNSDTSSRKKKYLKPIRDTRYSFIGKCGNPNGKYLSLSMI